MFYYPLHMDQLKVQNDPTMVSGDYQHLPKGSLKKHHFFCAKLHNRFDPAPLIVQKTIVFFLK